MKDFPAYPKTWRYPHGEPLRKLSEENNYGQYGSIHRVLTPEEKAKCIASREKEDAAFQERQKKYWAAVKARNEFIQAMRESK